MNPLKATMMQAVQGMELQSKRMGISSENISNADTPGYQRKLLIVSAQPSSADQFMQTRVQLDQTEGLRNFDPEHPMADADGYVTLSNVSLVTELADMREANRSYEANLNSFQQARSMYRSLLDVLRR
ncbi:MAG: flagellar basal body rod protein FlgC [Hyphomonas sp.]|jgi:flagellar basal-body rod protein FlgC|uniref:flagellar basal body rod C-terminal domain-containing protein n=1 Tax=Hyphomonas sp. TaxID=87 RepID=UPI001851CA5D|nr:flagellar basal body rod C-terminal domain-containing protein [Hyphomonas sp.]MBU3921798.1 flagellar basal body rod protein FlgC [Alphaproteobacteria bacterium]MBA3067891.1 flagellar basal body rod protein FlgC [Hyphomonas sp.]MBU4062447.1 flagellar basal body rod protein FlgC [Alphaproteobacteria bacterium]MBU4165944.1 flagellar basal body rod protein FlgC [Alphaproteobacteria bacterium]MBU4568086.1 flagellar basal body rod protein FlgC [Alphaproteobacteria bacterium]